MKYTDTHLQGATASPASGYGSAHIRRIFKLTYETETSIINLVRLANCDGDSPISVEAYIDVTEAFNGSGASIALQRATSPTSSGTDIIASSAVTEGSIGVYPSERPAVYTADSSQYININFTAPTGASTGIAYVILDVIGCGATPWAQQ